MTTEWMANGLCAEKHPSIFFPSDGVGVEKARKILGPDLADRAQFLDLGCGKGKALRAGEAGRVRHEHRNEATALRRPHEFL